MNLTESNLTKANLTEADLTLADLTRVQGLSMSILQIAGSRHRIVVRNADEVRIGCEIHPLSWWLKHYKAVGRREGYSETQIAEYYAHLKYVQAWLKRVEELAETM